MQEYKGKCTYLSLAIQILCLTAHGAMPRQLPSPLLWETLMAGGGVPEWDALPPEAWRRL